MQEKIALLEQELKSFQGRNPADLEVFRMKFISRKGALTELFEDLKKASLESKKEIGKRLNKLKQEAEAKFEELNQTLENSTGPGEVELDLTLPPIPNKTGNLHPLSSTRYRIIEIFERLGFSVADAPEIEDDLHNFSALNFTENHPAREMQHTFFLERNPDVLLRTHTSNVQIRLMGKQKPAIRAITPGRSAPHEAVSPSRSGCFLLLRRRVVDKT